MVNISESDAPILYPTSYSYLEGISMFEKRSLSKKYPDWYDIRKIP